MEKKSLFGVACSNGQKSYTALEFCINDLMKIGDSINALHIYDLEQGKSTDLRKSVNAILLSAVPSCRFSLVWVRKARKHLVAQIIHLIYECKYNYFLLGFSQEYQLISDLFMATLLEKSSCSLVIIKSDYLHKGSKNWIVCVDNPPYSFSVISKINELKKDDDNVCLIHVKQSENEIFTFDQIEGLNSNIQLFCIENQAGSIHESILIYIEERSIRAHFLVVSAYGETALKNEIKTVGKVTKNIVKIANNINVVVLR